MSAIARGEKILRESDCTTGGIDFARGTQALAVRGMMPTAIPPDGHQ
jgi:hypothetical protein